MMIEIFRTSISTRRTAGKIILALRDQFPGGHFTFDVDDCDHILRVEQESICPEQIIRMVEEFGGSCEVL